MDISKYAALTSPLGIAKGGVTAADVFNLGTAFLLSILVFAAMVVYMAQNPQKRTKLLRIFFAIMFLGGMAIYCSCEYFNLASARETAGGRWAGLDAASPLWRSLYTILYVVVKSVIDVGVMFYGQSSSSVFYALPISSNPAVEILFLLIHLIAFATAAGALMVVFGKELLKWLRMAFSRRSGINLVFGINPDSLSFARSLPGRDGGMLVFADTACGDQYESAIIGMGGLAYTDTEAVTASPSFLKRLRIRPGKTELRLFVMSQDYDKNLQYAGRMLGTLEQAGIRPDQTELVLIGADEWKGMDFQAGEGRYGYGSASVFDENELSARLLLAEYPLCNAINFDGNGLAAEDLDVLIIGFGHGGHEVLRKIIAGGQFEGSHFHAAIFDPNLKQRDGFCVSQYPAMFANYDIDFELHEGRSERIFQFLKERASKLKYIVVCLENQETARDVAIHVTDRLYAMGCAMNVYTCNARGVGCYSRFIKECASHGIYESKVIYAREMDRYAIKLNHYYAKQDPDYEEPGGPEADWRACGYFERMSSRASADYLIPLIRRMGKGPLTDVQMENLAKSEHRRWCAFLYTFGFTAMDMEEFKNRAKAYREEVRQYGKASFQPSKDMKRKVHACLVGWDELDQLSQIENAMTLGKKNYKDMDRSNVRAVLELMQEEGG